MKTITNINEVILPVTYPIITSYTGYANFMSILSNYAKTEAWIYNNFINLWAETTETGDTPFRFSSWGLQEVCPFITTTPIMLDLLYTQYDNFVDFFVSALSLGYYLFLSYDQYYIPHTSGYQKKHYSHQLFIYGFNKDTKQFYVADFFYGSKYSYQLASFHDVECAKSNDIKINPKSFIRLLKYNDIDYNFDINLFVKNISCYMNSTYTTLNYENASLYPEEIIGIKNGDIVFGMDYYERTLDILNSTINNNLQYIDIRPFHILYDHKVIMNKRLNFLERIGVINNIDKLYSNFKDIENRSLYARNLYLKYSITSDKRLLGKIINIIKSIKLLERESLSDLLNKIS